MKLLHRSPLHFLFVKDNLDSMWLRRSYVTLVITISRLTCKVSHLSESAEVDMKWLLFIYLIHIMHYYCCIVPFNKMCLWFFCNFCLLFSCMNHKNILMRKEKESHFLQTFSFICNNYHCKDFIYISLDLKDNYTSIHKHEPIVCHFN